MKLNKLYERVLEINNYSILEERYYKYNFPKDPSLQMYDFYVLDYLNTILTWPSLNHRDSPQDLSDSVKDAVKTFYPKLREHLLYALFYAISAEIRHAEANSSENYNTAKSKKLWFTIWKNYLKYYRFKTTSKDKQSELTDVYGVTPPTTDMRVPAIEKDNIYNRNLSYKAANYAIKHSNASVKDFIELTEHLFNQGNWETSFGGTKWGTYRKDGYYYMTVMR